MRILIIPDSFKHAISSIEAAEAIVAGIRRAAPEWQLKSFPVADGGEGTVVAMLAALGEGKTITVQVTGPENTPIDADYGISGDTAIIEMAAAAGLQLVTEPDPETTTTYGVGEHIRHALESGATRLIIGAGGSATNDLGCGAVAALGVKFFDNDDAEFLPTGQTLHRIQRIDTSELHPKLAGASLQVMTDVDNPLIGPHGAATIFGPQKGADAAAVKRLDEGARHAAEIITRDLGVDIANLSGSGAAGGFAGGMHAFLGASLEPGMDIMLDAIGFAELLEHTDLILTAEGQIDGQSLAGKVPVAIARKAAGTPVIVLSGSIGSDLEAIYEQGITAVFAIGSQPQSLADALKATAANLENTAFNIARTLSV